MFICTLGCGIDILMCYNFYFTYAGQLIQGIGPNMFSTINGEICDRWFNRKERAMALTISLLLREMGGAFSLILPTLFISSDTKKNTKEDIQNQTLIFNIFRCGLSAFFFILI